MKRTPEYEEEDQDTEKSLLQQEMLDLMRQVSEAKKSNILLKNQLQKKLLDTIVRDLDSPTDCDLSPQSQEILEIFKVQTARSMLIMQEALHELSSQALTSAPTLEEQLTVEDNNYGDDEASDEEAGYEEASDEEADGALTRSSSLIEIPLEDLQPQEQVQITGEQPSGYSRDCCTGTDCVML
jgi:hypothetical protein